jgi:hypothetical protein
MKGFITILLFTISFQFVLAKTGDTTKIRTIEFGKGRTAWFDFPDTTKKFSKILMNYKLKCPQGKQCGEWDYIANVYVRQFYAPSFRVDSNYRDTLRCMKNLSYSYTMKLVQGIPTFDSVPNKPYNVEIYGDIKNPTTRTGQEVYYPRPWKYSFNLQTQKVDSVLTNPDTTLIPKNTRVMYNDKVTWSDYLEIMRYITPYGNGLNLGNGFNWIMEVTDFQPLLTGKVFIDAPNGQEDLELTFDFIEGEPIREVQNIKKLWAFEANYDPNYEKRSPAVDYILNNNEQNAKVKIIQTGHGFGGSKSNCSEFCKKEGFLFVDGKKVASRFVWRECGDNPLFPQGGTWLIDRTNWCPGAEVTPFDFDISKYITAGTKTNVNWDMEYYDEPWTNGSNQNPHWVTWAYLVTYKSPTYKNDIEIVDIVSPSDKQLFLRRNPVCDNPIIQVRSNGTNDVNDFDIEYGLKGDIKKTANIKVSLKFGIITEIQLPSFEMTDPSKANLFEVNITKVNGSSDEVISNSMISSNYVPTQYIYNNVILDLNTNNYDLLGESIAPYEIQVFNNKNETIFERKNTQNSKRYIDTLNLKDGCYALRIANTLGYGLFWWALDRDNQGKSIGFKSASFKMLSGDINRFNYNNDFGNEVVHHFRTGPQATIASDIDSINFNSIKKYIVLTDTLRKIVNITPANKIGIKISKVDIPLGTAKGYSVESTTPIIPTDGINLKFGDTLKVVVRLTPKSYGIKSSNLIVQSNDILNPGLAVKLIANIQDPNGVSEEAEVSDLDFNASIYENKASFSIYSNELVGKNYSLKLYSYLGKELETIYIGKLGSLESKLEFDFSNLGNGAYFVAIEIGKVRIAKPLFKVN